MTAAEMGITKEDLRWAGIGHFNQVLNSEYVEGGIAYVAQTPYGHNYNGYQRNTVRAYIFKNGGIETLFLNLKSTRASQAISAYKAGDVGDRIPMWVWENYITNGYNTKRGLYADYSKKEDRIKRIARSHAEHIGGYDSKADHLARVALRNK